MYQLLSVTRYELEICASYFDTKEAAVEAMVDDIILSTSYESLEEILEAAKRDECGYDGEEAWAETLQHGTGQWNIIEIPDHKISITTPEGVITAETHGSRDDHPAIWIYKQKTADPQKMVAAVEYNTPAQCLRVEAYRAESDGPCSIIDHETGEELL